jgi:hypothetical protein
MSTQKRANDAQLIERIRRRLDEDAAGLDSAALSRLRQARQRALSAATQSRRPWWRARWLSDTSAGDWLVPAGAFTSIVATAFALTIMVAEPDNDLTREVEDLDLLTAGEELELYENLEFYQWLEDRGQTG